MGLKPLLSFSSGELDPVLHDFITLEKFKKGLSTGRNVMIGKTGSLLSRFSTAHLIKAKYADQPIRIYAPSNTSLLVEVGLDPTGAGYLRFYNYAGVLQGEIAPTYSPGGPALSAYQFEYSKGYLYLFTGSSPAKIDLSTFTTVAVGTAFTAPDTPNYSQTITAGGTPSGYRVDYAVTYVLNGEEYSPLDLTSLGTFLLPDAAGDSNTLLIRLTNTGTETSVPAGANEIRVYRRPNGGGAFGFIGSSTNFSIITSNLHCDFKDNGGLADFTNGTPEIITKGGLGGFASWELAPKTGVIYQQRLLMGNLTGDKEGILASRPGYQNNFQRDFPYDADSALNFKAGNSGDANVLRMIENDGLIVFTSIGVHINLGILNIDNIVLEKKGSWVIKEEIPPLVVPGGVFFVEEKTNAVRQFIFSENIQAYQATEASIFSNHLFKKKTISSWAYQDGVAPIIIVVFSDGTFATFTYNAEHQMRAWTRHDSVYPIEEVAGTDQPDATFFVVNKDGQRYIDVSLPREIPADTYVANPEADKLSLNCFSDSNLTKSNLLNDSLLTGGIFELVPTVVGDWADDLTLTCSTNGIFTVPGLGVVGTIMRFFDTTDKSTVDLQVVSRTSDNEVVVTPSATFPSAQASDFRLYETFNEITGLDHLEGENVTVMSDGYVVNSPNNDIEDYTPIVVASGTITLPNSMRGAIIIVGRPITADIKTLPITTVEQSPTMIESLTVNKLYIRIQESRGLYVNNIFPEEKDGEKDGSTVEGMEDLFKVDVPDGYDMIANRYVQPISKRVEQTIQGTWKDNGEIAIRQVDPLHFQILSIIPDVEVLTRSNR